MKLKKGLIKSIKENKKEELNQNKLKEKYNIKEDVKIIEKSNTIKFILKSFILLFKTSFNILFIILAFIGLISLIEPKTRQEIFNIINNSYETFKNLIFMT